MICARLWLRRGRAALWSILAAVFFLGAGTASPKNSDPISLEHCVVVITVDCNQDACPVYISNECGICIHARFNLPVNVDANQVRAADLPNYTDVTGQLSRASKAFKVDKLEACVAGGPTFETRQRVLLELLRAEELNGPFFMTRPMTQQELQGSRVGLKEVNFSNNFRVRDTEFIFRHYRRVWTKREIPDKPGLVTENADISEFRLTADLDELQPSITMAPGELSAKESGLDVNVQGQILTVRCKKPGCLQLESEKPRTPKGKVDQVSFFVKSVELAKAAKGALRELMLIDAQGWSKP
jgi:hypothetical protein